MHAEDQMDMESCGIPTVGSVDSPKEVYSSETAQGSESGSEDALVTLEFCPKLEREVNSQSTTLTSQSTSLNSQSTALGSLGSQFTLQPLVPIPVKSLKEISTNETLPLVRGDIDEFCSHVSGLISRRQTSRNVAPAISKSVAPSKPASGQTDVSKKDSWVVHSLNPVHVAAPVASSAGGCQSKSFDLRSGTVSSQSIAHLIRSRCSLLGIETLYVGEVSFDAIALLQAESVSSLCTVVQNCSWANACKMERCVPLSISAPCAAGVCFSPSSDAESVNSCDTDHFDKTIETITRPFQFLKPGQAIPPKPDSCATGGTIGSLAEILGLMVDCCLASKWTAESVLPVNEVARKVNQANSHSGSDDSLRLVMLLNQTPNSHGSNFLGMSGFVPIHDDHYLNQKDHALGKATSIVAGTRYELAGSASSFPMYVFRKDMIFAFGVRSATPFKAHNTSDRIIYAGRLGSGELAVLTTERSVGCIDDVLRRI